MMNEPDVSNAEAMTAANMPSLEDLLSQLIIRPSAPCGPSTKANVVVMTEQHIHELSEDGLNGKTCTSAVESSNITHVPISQAQPSRSLRAGIRVLRGPGCAEYDLRSLRIITVNNENVDKYRASVQGLLARIATAVLASETGAYAALCPNVPGWDVRVTDLSNAMDAAHRHPAHTPVLLPPGIPKAAGEALVSIMLPGGPSAYGWRYNDPDVQTKNGPKPNNRNATMPAYVRKLYPGGSERILVIQDHKDTDWTFGGAALNPVSLRALEVYMRRKFGNPLSWTKLTKRLWPWVMCTSTPSPRM
ncbi:hypothetical protein NW768_009957 [Fusarium equiseti]|uniref:Uncharacterized protein n=1 Tax=Fusarium equiseti TaxID=61235 RepID=A0ABQ8R1K6_FUSEQ|nr:hypothetical protein NW768_009957 [Fusarium equiseti]